MQEKMLFKSRVRQQWMLLTRLLDLFLCFIKLLSVVDRKSSGKRSRLVIRLLTKTRERRETINSQDLCAQVEDYNET